MDNGLKFQVGSTRSTLYRDTGTSTVLPGRLLLVLQVLQVVYQQAPGPMISIDKPQQRFPRSKLE
jgi:hypothetical protein